MKKAEYENAIADLNELIYKRDRSIFELKKQLSDVEHEGKLKIAEYARAADAWQKAHAIEAKKVDATIKTVNALCDLVDALRASIK